MIKVGIVGARGISGMAGYKAMPEDVEVTAICDINEDVIKEQSAKHGIKKTFRVYEDMLESDIDAVVIATPMQCHVPQAIAALNAGKHVMSEVTAGVTMDELYWLTETVENSGKIYMFAENYCYTPENQLIKELALKGYFGEIYSAGGEYMHELEDKFLFNANGIPTWRKYWQMGKRGAFYPTHSLGPIMQCMPEERIAEITTFSPGRHHYRPYLRQDDGSTTMCVTESGKLIEIKVDCSSHRPHKMDYYTLQGTKGIYEAKRGFGDEDKIAIDADKNPKGYHDWVSLWEYGDLLPERYKNATPEQKAAGHNGGDFFIVKDFIDAIKYNKQPELDVYKACEWTAVGLLSEISVANGSKTMKMPVFGPKGVRKDEYEIKF